MNPYLGWGEFCRNGVQIVEVPGDHLSVVEEPNVQTLAQKLAATISASMNLDDRARGDTRISSA
jgi:thioesterase domain-containing protein